LIQLRSKSLIAPPSIEGTKFPMLCSSSRKDEKEECEAMSGRILMTTVAALALAIPAMAQDKAEPLDTEATPQTEQGLPQEGAPEGATEQAPIMTEDAEGATEQAPAMTEDAEGAAETPAMTEELPADAPADQEMAEETPPADMEFLQVQEEAQFLANYEVIGADVVNTMDERVGTIADLVMDEDQKLVGVVLSVGGFLGIGEKWVAVPVDQIDFPSAEQPARLLATVTEEQLTNAPDFTTREALEAERAAADAALQQQAPAPAVPAQ
jgi:PRC-barrel domain